MYIIVQAPQMETDESPPPYCTSLECTCGNNCHEDPNYHLTVTSPLNNSTNDDIYEYASYMLGGK